MTKKLKSTNEAARGVIQKREQILQAIEKAKDERNELEGLVADALAQLASAEAESALDSDASKPVSARERLRELRDQLEQARLRVDGLVGKEQTLDDDFEKSANTLRQASSDEFADRRSAWEEQYREKVLELSAIVRQGQALIEGLGCNIPGMSSVLEALQLQLIDSDGHAIAPSMTGSVTHRNHIWREDKAAAAILAEFEDVAVTRRAIGRAVDAARERKRKRAQAEKAEARQAEMTAAAR